MSRRALITGASVAGNTAARALSGLGWHVTVVERSPAFRDGGQNIDVRGVGREVMRRLGLEQAALAQGTGEEGTAWIDETGKAVAVFDTDELGADGPTAEMEILRGDLARLLYEAARGQTTYRFGDHITAIEPHGDAPVVATFASGAQDAFDLVIVAEGVGSTTRDLVFPGENEPRWMDLTLAYFTIPAVPDDDRHWRWYHTTGGRSVSLRPHRSGRTSAMLSVQQPPGGANDWPIEQQQQWLRDTFADAGWQAPRVLAGLAASDDFYFDVLRQVQMARWHHGRVVLTGDAAWCATPIAGAGTTLAVTGAYVLAGELSRHDDIGAALQAYDAAMRPMVTQAQGVPKIAPRLMNPHSRLGLHLLHGALRIASQPVVRGAAARLFAAPPEGPDLSGYRVS